MAAGGVRPPAAAYVLRPGRLTGGGAGADAGLEAVEFLLRSLAHRPLEPFVRREHVPAAEEEQGSPNGDRRVVDVGPQEAAVPRDPLREDRHQEEDADERDPENCEWVDP